MSYHNRRVDRIMFRNPVAPDWYNPVQSWTCPGCKRECAYNRCPFIQCPLHKDFQLRETPMPPNRYNMRPCSYCGMHGCQCGALNMFSTQLLEMREMRNRKMRERREAMTQFFVFLMIVFFVVIFITCMLQTK